MSSHPHTGERQQVTLPYPPSVNNLYGNHPLGGRYLRAAGQQYKRDAGLLARAAGLRRCIGPVAVILRVWRPRRRGDIDGIVKVLLDSLTGIAWDDDACVCELHIYRDDDKERPRVEVTVEEVADGRAA